MCALAVVVGAAVVAVAIIFNIVNCTVPHVCRKGYFSVELELRPNDAPPKALIFSLFFFFLFLHFFFSSVFFYPFVRFRPGLGRVANLLGTAYIVIQHPFLHVPLLFPLLFLLRDSLSSSLGGSAGDVNVVILSRFV